MYRHELFTKLLSDTLDENNALKLYIRLDELPDKVLVMLIDELIDDIILGDLPLNEKYHLFYQNINN